MTSIVVMPLPDGILALSDTASTNPSDGRIMSFSDKVTVFPAWQMLVAASGLANFERNLLARIGNEVRDFDEFQDEFEHHAPAVHCSAIAYHHGEELPGIGMCIAGRSERRRRWISSCATSYPKRSVNLETGEETIREPWALGSAGDLWMCAMPKPDHAALCGIDLARMSELLSSMDPLDLATRLVCATRLQSGACEPGDETAPAFFQVGGSLVLTLLSKDYCQQTIVHRWPDRIGRSVDLSLPFEIPTLRLWPEKAPA